MAPTSFSMTRKEESEDGKLPCPKPSYKKGKFPS